MNLVNDIVLLARAWDFAARRHADQRRKGQRQEPYVNHLAEVAELVATATAGRDANLVAAAVLHDTVEDTETELDELRDNFNDDIAALVADVTDDKSLPREDRKQRQIDHAPGKPPRAKILKLADKTSNLRSLAQSPPVDWSLMRRRDYVVWAVKVAAGLKGANPWIDARFEEAVGAMRAKLTETADP